jgi:hypothetical protein
MGRFSAKLHANFVEFRVRLIALPSIRIMAAAEHPAPRFGPP